MGKSLFLLLFAALCIAHICFLESVFSSIFIKNYTNSSSKLDMSKNNKLHKNLPIQLIINLLFFNNQQ